jgi:hypothetical protein
MRGLESRRRWRSLVVLVLVAAGCSLPASPVVPPKKQLNQPTRSWAPREPIRPATEADGGRPRAAGTPAPATPTTTQVPRTDDEDAGRPADAALPQGPVAMLDAGAPVVMSTCPRDVLQRKADEYLQALAAGEPELLSTHPSLRYTEDGRETVLGRGMWLRRWSPIFARHIADDQRCATLTEAVLTTLGESIILGLRLQHVDGQLLEAEAQVAVATLRYVDPDGVIPAGADPWLTPAEPRAAAAALTDLAARFVAGAVDPSVLPPAAPGCILKQNGVVVGTDQDCLILPPEDEPFEQVRYPVTDATLGVTSAIVKRSGFIAMLLFKIEAGALQHVEVFGVTRSQTTGW